MFIKVPSELVYDTSIDNLELYLYILIKGNKGFAKSGFGVTLSELVKLCGYKPNPNKGKSNELVAEALENMKRKDLISSGDVDSFSDLRPNQFVEIVLNNNSKYEKESLSEKNKSWAMLEEDVLKNIYTINSPDRVEIVRIYLLLISSMYPNTRNISFMKQENLYTYIKRDGVSAIRRLIPIMEQKKLIYVYRDKIPKGVDGKFSRFACYALEPFTNELKAFCYKRREVYNK